MYFFCMRVTLTFRAAADEEDPDIKYRNLIYYFNT